MSKNFAVFDIDGTLLRWQFFHAIVNQLGKNGLLTNKEHQIIKDARMDWKNRTSSDSFHAYEQVLVKTYLDSLPRISPAQHRLAEDTVYKEYKNQLFTYTRDLISALKKQGYFILAISGSHQYIVSKLCKDLQIDDYLAAEAEQIDSKYTGIVSTPIIDKSAALQKLVAKNNLTYKYSFAIGDSASDAAMLAQVDNPIAFNPDKKLYDIAIDKEWPIVIERKNVVYELGFKDGQYGLRLN